MPTLVTGGTGFIGGNLVRALVRESEEIKVLVRKSSRIDHLEKLGVEIVYGDLNNRESLAEAIKGCERLYHTAALFKVLLSRREKKKIYEVNVEGTRNILSAALEEGVDKVVFTSTIATLAGGNRNGFITENIADAQPLPSDYAKSKHQAEIEASKICENGLPLVVVIPTWVIGPGDYRPTPSGETIVNFLNKRLPGYINGHFNLVYVQDVVRGHILAAEKGRVGERYLLGGDNISMKQLMDLLEELSGVESPRRIPKWVISLLGILQPIWTYVTGKPPIIPVDFVSGSNIDFRVDCSKAQRELGYNTTPIRSALIETVRWFREVGYAPR